MVTAAGASATPATATGTTTTAASTTTSTTTSGVAAARHTISSKAEAHAIAYWSHKAARARAGTSHWLMVVRGRPVTGFARYPASRTPRSARRLARLWTRREQRAFRLAHHPPKLRAWTCIHHYEGSWTDHGAPYWGGLQMDYSFQSAYAPWLLRHHGTADNWTPLEQIWAAVRAWRVRGFSPWPNTARDCGV